MSNYEKVKAMHIVAIISTVLVLGYAFDFFMLLAGLTVGWVMWCFGLTISLHKMSSHKTFEPKNKFIKYFLLWCGAVVTMGTAIDFAAGHRQHHKFSDTDKDPYNIEGSFWHKFKLFFYWFPTAKISPLVIKDLLKDKEHSFFNNHYWKIVLPYPIILLLIDPVCFGYFYALPVVYVLLGMGYVTVWAHLPYLKKLGTVPHETDDNSWDSLFFTMLLAGEGYHNTHHKFPGNWNYGKYDVSGKLIRYLKSNG